MKTDLSKYNNSLYNPGSLVRRILWVFINGFFFKSSWNLSSRIKLFWLRVFGAQLGSGIVIKTNVNIKYPWKLEIGNHCWIGEEVWIDNLDNVKISDNVCISQGAMLLCGNHDYSKPGFDLMLGPITIEEGAWIGAKAVVCPKVKVMSHAVLCVGSVATKNLDSFSIYQGNPAIKIKDRIIS